MQPKRRFQISIRIALLMMAFAAAAITLWTNLRSTLDHRSGIVLNELPNLNVPEQFDLKKLGSLVNSTNFLRELAKEEPQHRELLQNWNVPSETTIAPGQAPTVPGEHGVSFQYAEPGSFQMVIAFPAYVVRHRKRNWNGIESSMVTSGDSEIDKMMMQRNDNFRALVLRKVYEHVHALASGQFSTSPKAHEQYLPSGTSGKPY